MKPSSFLLLSILALAPLAQALHAAPPDAAKKEESADDDKPALHAALAKDKDSKPTTTFTADVPKIYAFWIGDDIEKGDKIRSVWIAEDVGAAAPKETKIDEATLTATKDNDTGAFSLSRPNNGWPVGSYRVEIYVGDDLATTLKFTIEAAK